MPKFLFESERLGFSDWRNADVEAMIAISADPQVMRFFPYEATRQQTLDFIQRNNALLDQKGYCYFAVVEKESGRTIGFTGLYDQDYESEFTPATDIGWRLGVEFQGKGYATEAARRCLEYAFKVIELPRVVAMAPAVNLPSINVMRKIGMTQIGEFVHPRLTDNTELRNCVCFEIKT
ncbi:GNAT family N-acetyltransferase [Phaeocystidibacter luteus]|uniref:GNAT family N-acetyltransferase n=1 Tax=Phaeocystidibacter luteus TaxID=911197 RepID=UPI001478BE52|nr:GNAT family N-acetyltransferase [Phaeocystidibacter luteus]